MKHFRGVAAISFVAVLLGFGFTCSKTQSSTLTTYKSLVAARAALAGFSKNDPTLISKFKPQINEAIDASNTADSAFVLAVNAGASGDVTQLSANVASLTSSVISIVADLTAEFNVPKAAEIRAKYSAKKASLKKAGVQISLVDILSYLQLADSAASAFLAANPQAAAAGAIANVLLSLAKNGILAYQAANTIDLSVFATPLPHI